MYRSACCSAAASPSSVVNNVIGTEICTHSFLPALRCSQHHAPTKTKAPRLLHLAFQQALRPTSTTMALTSPLHYFHFNPTYCVRSSTTSRWQEGLHMSKIQDVNGRRRDDTRNRTHYAARTNTLSLFVCIHGICQFDLACYPKLS